MCKCDAAIGRLQSLRGACRARGGEANVGAMKLGIHLPQIGGNARDIARVAVRAEQSGYDSLWVSDHILVPESGGTIQKLEIMDPVPTLAYVAAITTRVRLATSVMVVPYRNAIALGKELATIDRLCGGRLVVGAASGWLEAEF